MKIYDYCSVVDFSFSFFCYNIIVVMGVLTMFRL